jgi:TPR repeat protein
VYGLGGPERVDRGIASLRRAASADLAEAQMALGDYFQAADPARPQDALYWYRRAGKLGDARAAGRAAHLERRIKLDAERPTPPPDTIVNPTPRELQDLYRQGYHCHAVLGEKWCHLANDI